MFLKSKFLWAAIFFISALIIISCSNNEMTEEEIKEEIKEAIVYTGPEGPDDIKTLKSKVWLEGDTTAYYKLTIEYLHKPASQFLFWNIYMANKYDYKQAYLDVYYSLLEAYKIVGDYSLDKMDKKTRILALKYLKTAAEKKHSGAKKIFDKYCSEGKYVTKEGEIIDEDEFP